MKSRIFYITVIAPMKISRRKVDRILEEFHPDCAVFVETDTAKVDDYGDGDVRVTPDNRSIHALGRDTRMKGREVIIERETERDGAEVVALREANKKGTQLKRVR